MGPILAALSKCKEIMRVVCIVFVAIAVAAAFDNDSVEEFMTNDMPEEDESLMQVVAKLRGVVPGHMTFHVDRIKHHAELMQSAGFEEDDKAKAYSHNFSSSKAAIQAALNGLTSQLQTGHNHDVAALNSSHSDNTKSTNDAETDGKSKTHGFRNKACPTKRKEIEADTKKKNAKTTMQDVAKGKICSGLGSTWGDMDVDKTAPKYGTELRNAWDKARARYVAAKTAYEAAIKEHEKALAAHNTAMAAFKTALDVEVSNADSQCKNAHNEYAVLKGEVQSNVNSRKQVYIAVGVVKCYIDNLANNGRAKACSDAARAKDTSRWNITPKDLGKCTGKTDLEHSFGPKHWTPTTTTCASEHWNKKDDVEFYATLYDNQ